MAKHSFCPHILPLLLTQNIECVFCNAMHELAHPLIEVVSLNNTYCGQQVVHPCFFCVEHTQQQVVMCLRLLPICNNPRLTVLSNHIRYGIICRPTFIDHYCIWPHLHHPCEFGPYLQHTSKHQC